MSFQLVQGLHRAVQAHPYRIATICGERQQTYKSFTERVARLAGALQKQGMAKGDRVGMLALNSDRFLEYFFACWWGGGAVNPINIRWSAAEVAYSLDDCETKILLVDDAYKDMAEELQRRSASLRTIIYVGDGDTPAGMQNYEAILSESCPIADAGCGGDDLAIVMYTGGTTGFPKGVMHSHATASVGGYAVEAGLFEASSLAPCSLLVAPLFHVIGVGLAMANFIAGGTAIVEPFSPLDCMESIEKHRASQLILAPAMLQMVMDHPDVNKFDMSSVISLAYGGAVISESVLRRAMSQWPSARFRQVYGMTEMFSASWLNPHDHHLDEGVGLRLRSAGRAHKFMTIRIVNGNGEEVERGTVGEISASGPSMMLGYWNSPEQTKNTIQDGWIRSGDGAYMDENGYIFIVDRVKDMIVSGGENIYSAEVENALAKHPAVVSCAVIGIPDKKWGEAVHGVIVLAAGKAVTAEELVSHCREYIAGYKIPRTFDFLESLPLSAAGKVQKNILREPYWRNTDRAVN